MSLQTIVLQFLLYIIEIKVCFYDCEKHISLIFPLIFIVHAFHVLNVGTTLSNVFLSAAETEGANENERLTRAS